GRSQWMAADRHRHGENGVSREPQSVLIRRAREERQQPTLTRPDRDPFNIWVNTNGTCARGVTAASPWVFFRALTSSAAVPVISHRQPCNVFSRRSSRRIAGGRISTMTVTHGQGDR